MQLAELSVEDAAQIAAGNWTSFHCFWWSRSREVDDPDNWAIFYTHHRDSRLLDRSNAEFIKSKLMPFTDSVDPDVVFETHDHFAFGRIDGFSIRVFKDNGITEAFRKYHELMEKLNEYPILDETDYSDREYEATLRNITEIAWKLKKQFELPEGWTADVYSWLFDNDPSEVDNRDDQGGYPTEEALKRAMKALKYRSI